MAYLGTPSATAAVIEKYQFNFQKRYGQNFLIDTNILKKIIEEAGVTKEDCVVEIGPGIGTMTQYLAESAREVVAVEIDKNLIPILEDTLSEYDNVTVINEDILKVDLRKLAEEIFPIISQRLLLWACLKIRCPFPALPLWFRRKWRTGCRLARAPRIMVRSA